MQHQPMSFLQESPVSRLESITKCLPKRLKSCKESKIQGIFKAHFLRNFHKTSSSFIVASWKDLTGAPYVSEMRLL